MTETHPIWYKDKSNTYGSVKVVDQNKTHYNM